MVNRKTLSLLIAIAAGLIIFSSGCSLQTLFQPTRTDTINASTAKKVSQMYAWGKGVINSFSLSPDGKQVGIATSTGIALYDTTTWQNQTLFAKNHFNTAEISNDWSLVALAENNGVTVYQLASQTQLVHINIQQGIISQLKFTPDDHYLLAFSSVPAGEGFTIQIQSFSLPDGSPISSWDAGAILDSAISSDGKTLYTWNSTSAHGINRASLPDGKTLPSMQSITASALALSPDGKTLAAFDGKIEIVDPGTATILHSLADSPQDVMWLGYSPDGSQLVSISSLQVAQIWQMPEEKLLRTYPVNHDSQVKAVFSRDGSDLAIETLEGLEIRRVADGDLVRSLDGYSAGINNVGFNPDNTSIVGTVDNTSRYPDLVAWKLFSPTPLFQLNKTQATTLAYSKDGKRLVLGLSGGGEQILDAQTGKILQNLKEHANDVQSLAFSPDNTLVASSAFDIRWWRVSDGSLMHDVSFPIGMGTSVSQVAFSPDGSKLAAFSDGFAGLWKVSDGSALGTLQVNPQIQYGYIAFVPNTNTLAVAFQPNAANIDPKSQPAALEFWSISDQKLIRTITLGEIQIISMAFSPDGSVLAFGLDDGSIQLRKTGDGSLITTLTGHASSVSGLAFSMDSRYLVSGSEDGTIRLWGLPVK